MNTFLIRLCGYLITFLGMFHQCTYSQICYEIDCLNRVHDIINEDEDRADILLSIAQLYHSINMETSSDSTQQVNELTRRQMWLLRSQVKNLVST